MHYVCQREYVLLNYIDFYGVEREICHDCVDELRVMGKLETLKKVGESTVYGTEESEEDEEELEGTVLGGGGDEVSVMNVVYPRGTVSVSSISSFSSVISLSKPSHPSLLLSLVLHLIKEYFKKKRWRKRK